MRKYSPAILITLIISTLFAGSGEGINFFDRADIFFKKYVHDGRVNYRQIREEPRDLQQLVAEIASFNLTELPAGNDRKAFWLNAYNILVIDGIAAHYPVESPLDIDGFFKTMRHAAAGEQLTLDEIENLKIRQMYHDPRIHFALVCAARGCPPLHNRAFIPGLLDEQLDENAVAILNTPDFVRVQPEKKLARLSEIFKWFKHDFEMDGSTLIGFINRFREKKIPPEFAIQFYPYDWRLNRL